ncbi:GIY-YIG nuclease family protein [Aureibaculum sp. A20]|uniref:GIY-YIG nuclease family protein n=1 Tax=Aureibaculum flavum TaxID=2795986 RepID=A0ABS0WQT2_9FLAO|nr:exonuclease domain-containing protein [Aureibaculum flavum]MBJ2174344.1 GIY-YIG nuclease family protein [Aureibaculum flavum]
MNFKESKFSIVDVETTGGVRVGRMTEICIITVINMEIVDVYQSLINPETPIPTYITALTGISDEMVYDAPKFHEIAEIIEMKMRDSIFVAHNVNFDFGFLKKEFEIVGEKFLKEKLCTVRLSRKLIPGLPSYSLSKLCRSVGIELNGAHRAEADTRATTILFLNLLKLDSKSEYEVLNKHLGKSSVQTALPANLPIKDFEKLPSTPGVYIFKDLGGKIIYVGKDKNIKKKVLAHFYSKSQKIINICNETHALDFEKTGNELSALLLEADYISQYTPKFNQTQKKPTSVYQIISYENQLGVLQLALHKGKVSNTSVETLFSTSIATETLTKLCEKFNLCPKYCSLQVTNGSCSHSKIKNCLGICSQQEDVDSYNERVKQALYKVQNEQKSYAIVEKGRTSSETCVILIENGEYKGFGFIDNENVIEHFEGFKDYVKHYNNNFFTSKIVSAYLHKNSKSLKIIKADTTRIN